MPIKIAVNCKTKNYGQKEEKEFSNRTMK